MEEKSINAIASEQNKHVLYEGVYKPVVIDTIVKDIFGNKYIKKMETDGLKIFEIGNDGMREKELLYEDGRCSDMLDNGAGFLGNSIESGGGVNRKFQNMCNAMIKKKAGDEGKAKIASLLINNFWIRFSVMFQKSNTVICIIFIIGINQNTVFAFNII